MSSIVKSVSDFLGITSALPSTTAQRKRKAHSEPSRNSKYRRYSAAYDPRDYQNASYAGSGTMVTTDEELTDERHPRAGPSRPQIKARSLKTVPHEPRKTTSPTTMASRDKIRTAAEARAFGPGGHHTIAEHRSEAVYTGKGKQPAGPIVEIQPDEFYTDSNSELEFDLGFVDTPATARTTNPAPMKTTKYKVHPAQQKPLKTTTKAEEKPRGWDDFTVQKKWEAKPNLRARELVAVYRHGSGEAIKRETREPEYAFRDAEIRDGLWQLMDQMERFAKQFFQFEYKPAAGIVPREWYEDLTPQTAKVIGCVASGGPAGVHGWHDLFTNEQKRRALVCAIIGNVLVEQVFQHIFFGGQAADIKTVTALQEKHRNEDGFDRNKHYALATQKMLKKRNATDGLELPANFNNHVKHIVGAIWTHLAPIIRLSPQHVRKAEMPNEMFSPLHKLSTQAGILSLLMRVDPHTVYYFEPVFKEDNFTSKRMECFNSHAMQQRHPRHTPEEQRTLDKAEQQRRAALSDAEKKCARNDDPLTQITIMHGLCAYRLGGWETAASTLAAPVYEKQEYKTQGVRARVLTHGWVYCRWGRARRFKDGGPDDGGEKVHGDAWKGGFVEFADVKGVYPWLERERAEKKKEADVARAAYQEKNGAKGKGKEKAVFLDDEEENDAGVGVAGPSTSTRRRRGSAPRP